MLNVMQRPDARDWTSLPPDDATPRRARRRRRRLRIAYSPTLGYADGRTRRWPPRSPPQCEHWPALGADVEQVDPGFDDPLEITTGLWFTGAWTLWNTLTPEQQEVTDPDFAAEAELGFALSQPRRAAPEPAARRAGLAHAPVHERFDLLATPAVAVPAFDARPAGHRPMTPESMLGWTPFSYPFNLTQQPAITVPCGLTTRRPADRPPARRSDVRRRRSSCAPPAPTSSSTPCRVHRSELRVLEVRTRTGQVGVVGVRPSTYQAASTPPVAPKRWPVNETPGRGRRPHRMPP